jgi:hypothetical protein
MVLFNICFVMFGLLLKEFGYSGPVSHARKHQLRASLLAIVGEGVSRSPQQWMTNSEPISLELVRQSLAMAGLPPSFNLDRLQKANLHLRAMLYTTFSDHAASLEATMLPQIVALVDRHVQSSPMDLFNNLTTLPAPPLPLAPSHILPPTHHNSNHTLPPHSEQFTDIPSRITHIILLHWRTWGPIAYVQDNENPVAPRDESLLMPAPPPVPQAHSPSPANAEAPVMLKTGEPPESGHETPFAPEASFP